MKVKFISLILLILFLCSCIPYSPSLYSSYDVLRPGEEVLKNPLGFTEDGNIIVNVSYILWVDELKVEIKRLRKLVK